VARQGAELVAYAFLVELSFLHGARRLGPAKVHSLITY
jgi:adenine phosphoribosyltransferase